MNFNPSSAQAVVVLPGIMGSVLTLNGQTVWPRPISELVFGFSHLDLLLSDELRATDILRSVSVSTQYASLLDLLTRCGFRESVNLFPFAYDWRRSNVLSAEKLADLLDQISVGRGNPEIHLVAHSMGGLISRYYLESGDFSSRPAFSRVRSLFALAARV